MVLFHSLRMNYDMLIIKIRDQIEHKDTPAVGRYAPLKPSVCDGGLPVLLCRPAERTENMVSGLIKFKPPCKHGFLLFFLNSNNS